MEWTTKDSGKREKYASGMIRDTQEGKPRFDLCHAEGVPYNEQMLTRFAALMARGVTKYGERNWELAEGKEELNRFRGSALRHMQQWYDGEEDEDHQAAVLFNLMAAETLKYKLKKKEINGSSNTSKESRTTRKESPCDESCTCVEDFIRKSRRISWSHRF